MIVYGKHVVLHLLAKHPQKINEIFLAKEIDPKIFSQMIKLGIKITRLDFKKAQSMARGGNHQGYLAQIYDLQPMPWRSMMEFASLVVLCGVSDVGNIASIVRSAYALGVGGLVLDGTLSSKVIESVVRLSSGAMLEMPFCFSTSLLDHIHQLKQAGFMCYGTHMEGEDICKISPAARWALFLGSEGDGLNKKIIQKMDRIVSINMKHGFDSLNVGVAGGIFVHRLVSHGK
ncbi:23S rRNA (guanosine(2251)-2'-O)-methyltransferase RlmB [Helicobacter pametensis]|uniref:23S rRNA (guanosine(2251)-2'-O)-methyltransferase RlmB n=1 Tax=Helicobacter pametensis TaxID=95149 RepID=UPI00048562DD|nr:23S rRNA (guanosine(2251)-2'-O)-methyltransferase RlmB [Helicobacter pametensis]